MNGIPKIDGGRRADGPDREDGRGFLPALAASAPPLVVDPGLYDFGPAVWRLVEAS